jgi:hypothetical protein
LLDKDQCSPGSKPRIVRCPAHNSDWSGYQFMIGNDPISGNRHFTGSIDEVYVFRGIALTAAEVAANHAAHVCP